MLKVRNANQQDLNFIRASWFESWWKREWKEKTDFETYEREVGNILRENLLSAQALVAYFDNAPEEVVSYIVSYNKTLYYVYTKHAFRGLGFAKILLQAVKPTEYTCNTGRKWRTAAEKMGMTFNPWALKSTDE